MLETMDRVELDDAFKDALDNDRDRYGLRFIAHKENGDRSEWWTGPPYVLTPKPERAMWWRSADDAAEYLQIALTPDMIWSYLRTEGMAGPSYGDYDRIVMMVRKLPLED